MLKYNYHTHTFRCRHASLKDEEAVLEAIRLGIKKLGFADHLNISSFYNNNGWGSEDLMKDYEETILNLKEKYRDQIEIYLGYECEYYPHYEEKLRDLLNRPEIDYLILGNHYNNSMFSKYYGAEFDEEDFEIYFKYVKGAIDSKLFSYIAHPDLFMSGYRHWDENTEKLSIKICQYAKNNKMALELNCGGIRKGKTFINGVLEYHLPYYKFWKIAKEIDNEIVIGIDAHNVKDFEHPSYKDLFEMIEKNNLKISEDFNIIKKK